MKHSITVEILSKMIPKTFGLILFFSLSQCKNLFMPNLPMGEYRLVVDKVFRCESRKNHSIKHNIYLSQKTSRITELKGNITFLTPLDDNLIVEINFSSWGTTGGWISNAHLLNSKNACSTIKKMLGNGWITMCNAFKVPVTCPIPVGTYFTSGYDLTKLQDNNVKIFYYGKYKGMTRFKNAKNDEIGCIGFEVNIIRPWETPI